MTNQQPTTKAETRPVGSVPVNHETSPTQPTLPGMEDLTPQAETRPLGSVSKTADELAEENAQLKAEIHIRTAIYDIETRLKAAGARSPNLLADRAKERFQFSEEGDLTNAEAVVEQLKRTYPEQFTPASIDAAAGRIQRPTLTKEALAKMTAAEIQRLDWNEVRSALAQ
ncbi:MAG TPA: hypothetical protein PLK77_09620 [Pyrinomonadaceae bacterium]|nr:hypothetical protein [Pyrinomonadaceae bacterium]